MAKGKKNATIEILRTAAGAAFKSRPSSIREVLDPLSPVQVYGLLAVANNCFAVGDVVLHEDIELGVG